VNLSSEISLRISTIDDFDLMCAIELNPENLHYTTLEMPDVNDIRAFLSNGQDLQLNQQVRYTILWRGNGIGFIDLTEFDIVAKVADVGIYILPQFRRKKFAHTALFQLKNSAKQEGIATLRALIKTDNIQSCHLFQKAEYMHTEEVNGYCIYELKLSF
jgi:RimJ/RimL family protein N-acetyltransferase